MPATWKKKKKKKKERRERKGKKMKATLNSMKMGRQHTGVQVLQHEEPACHVDRQHTGVRVQGLLFNRGGSL